MKAVFDTNVFIVTLVTSGIGDADLLALKNFKGVQILSPRNFELLFID